MDRGTGIEGRFDMPEVMGPGVASECVETKDRLQIRQAVAGPIGIGVFNARGLQILLSEIRRVLLPAAALAAMGLVPRRALPPPPAETE